MLAVLALFILMTFWSISFEGMIYAEGDTINDAIFYNQVDLYRIVTGEVARYNPYVFGGIPNIFNLPKSNLTIDGLLDVAGNLLSLPLVFFLLGGFGQFVLLRYLKFTPLQSLFGSMVFVFAPYYKSLVIAGHGTKIEAIMYLPWIIWSLLRVMKNRKGLDVVFLTLVVALQIRSSHFQVVFYSAILCGIIAIYYFIRDYRIDKRLPWKVMALLSLAVVGSLVLSARPLMLASQYAGDSVRGREVIRITDDPTIEQEKGVSKKFVSTWSFLPSELATILLPRAKGGTSKEYFSEATRQGFKEPIISSYWGHSPFNGSYYYAGAIVFFLVLVAFFYYRQDSLILPLGITMLLMLIWSLGTFAGPIYSISYSILPFFSNFRTPTTSMALVYFIFSILSVFGLRSLTSLVSDKKKLRILFYVVLGIGAALFLGGQMSSFEKAGEKLPTNQLISTISLREQMFNLDLMWFVVAVVLFAGILFLLRAKKLTYQVSIMLMLCIAMADLGRIWNSYSQETVRKTDFERVHLGATEATTLLKADQDVFRVFALSTQNFDLPAYVQTIGGGFDMQMNTKMYELSNNNLFHKLDGKAQINWNVLDFMNVKYVASEIGFEHERLTLEISDPSKGVNIYRYKFNRDRGFFFDGFQVIEDPIERMKLINDPTFDARHTAILEETPSVQVFPASRSKVDLITFEANKSIYTVETENPGLFVISEVYTPALQELYLDGERIDKVYRTNHAIQSVVVPQGIHTIEVRYKEAVFATSSILSNLGFVAVYLLLTFFLYRDGMLGFLTGAKKKE